MWEIMHDRSMKIISHKANEHHEEVEKFIV